MSACDTDLDRLLERLRAGDEQALGPLFARYRDGLRRMVDFRLDRRLRGRVDPSDVLQEAYLDARRRIGHYVNGPHQMPFLIWLRQITQQSLIDLHRQHLVSQKRDVRRDVSLDRNFVAPGTSACLVAQLLGQSSSPSQHLVRAELEELLERAIEQMDPVDREVLVLRHFEELRNNEVAEVLGLQPSAASNRYFRALQRLRAILSSIPGFLENEGRL